MRILASFSILCVMLAWLGVSFHTADHGVLEHEHEGASCQFEAYANQKLSAGESAPILLTQIEFAAVISISSVEVNLSAKSHHFITRAPPSVIS